jgi:dihydropyrimidine dehydrogenase (NADP+)
MTPNITDIKVPARRAMKAGMAGVSAINTIQSVMSINLDTLRPEPCVEGHSTPGGYSGKAVKPIALAKCMELSRLIQDEFGKDKSLSAIGGVESGTDAAEYLLLGASTVQVRVASC